MAEGIAETIGTVVKGVMVGLGLSSGIGLIVMIVSSFQPLVSMIGALIKILGLTLKPIGDIVMVLLYPILLILKPIISMIRTLFMPFLQLALSVMTQGVKKIQSGDIAGGSLLLGLATFDIIQGVAFVLNAVLFEFLQLMGGIILQILLQFIGFFFPMINDKIPDIMNLYNSVVDGIQGVMLSGQLNVITAMNNAMGVDTMKFFTDSIEGINKYLTPNNKISGVFTEDILSFTNKVQKDFTNLFDISKEGSPGNTMDYLVKEMGKRGAKATRDIVKGVKDNAIAEFKYAINPSNWFNEQSPTKEVIIKSQGG